MNEFNKIAFAAAADTCLIFPAGLLCRDPIRDQLDLMPISQWLAEGTRPCRMHIQHRKPSFH